MLGPCSILDLGPPSFLPSFLPGCDQGPTLQSPICVIGDCFIKVRRHIASHSVQERLLLLWFVVCCSLFFAFVCFCLLLFVVVCKTSNISTCSEPSTVKRPSNLRATTIQLGRSRRCHSGLLHKRPATHCQSFRSGAAVVVAVSRLLFVVCCSLFFAFVCCCLLLFVVVCKTSNISTCSEPSTVKRPSNLRATTIQLGRSRRCHSGLLHKRPATHCQSFRSGAAVVVAVSRLLFVVCCSLFFAFVCCCLLLFVVVCKTSNISTTTFLALAFVICLQGRFQRAARMARLDSSPLLGPADLADSMEI